LAKAICRLFMPLGYGGHDDGGSPKKPSFPLGDRLLFRPLKKSLGLHHARLAYTFGSVIHPEVQRFFHALGLPLKDVYVSTEAGPLCGWTGPSFHLGTIGPLSEREGVKIGPQGELLFRRDTLFSGYFGEVEKGPVPEGWYPSGDAARTREDGRIEVLGRLSELTALVDGRTFSPQALESRLRFSPYIRDAWVWAEGERARVFALVVTHFAEIGRWAGRNRIPFSGPADLCLKEEVQGLISGEIRRINAEGDPLFRIQKYVLFPRELDPDLGEMTRNRKLRRFVLQERFREVLEAVRSNQKEVLWESPSPPVEGEVRVVQSPLKIIALEEKG